MKSWEKKETRQEKPAPRYDELTIAQLKDRPEWDELRKLVLSRASTKKIKLYSEDLSGKEYETGRLIGWLACCEYILGLPDSLVTKIQEKSNV